MPSFDNQLDALADSMQSLCQNASECDFKGDGWAPAITLGHIVDVDSEVWMARFELMVSAVRNSQSPPQLANWEPDGEKTAEKYSGYALTQSIELLKESRSLMHNYLKSLTIDERQAPAIHMSFGNITIESMLAVILNHDEEHRATLI